MGELELEQTDDLLIDDLLSDWCPNCHNPSDGGLRFRVIIVDNMVETTVTCTVCGCNVVFTGILTNTKFGLSTKTIEQRGVAQSV